MNVDTLLCSNCGNWCCMRAATLLPSRSCHQLTRQTLLHCSALVHLSTRILVYIYHGSLEYLGMSPFNTVDPGTLVHAYPGTPVHSVMSPFNTANRSKLTRLTENRHQLGPFCAGNLSDNQAAALILLILHHNQTRVQVVQLYNQQLQWIKNIFFQGPSLQATPSLYIYKLTRRKEVNCFGPALHFWLVLLVGVTYCKKEHCSNLCPNPLF